MESENSENELWKMGRRCGKGNEWWFGRANLVQDTVCSLEVYSTAGESKCNASINRSLWTDVSKAMTSHVFRDITYIKHLKGNIRSENTRKIWEQAQINT